MKKLVEQLSREYDMILFDSPPIVAVTDASLIAAEADSLALVIKAGSTDKLAVDRALDTVKNIHSKLAGVILNGINPETLSGKYSYYYSYYEYYHHTQDDAELSGFKRLLKRLKKLYS